MFFVLPGLAVIAIYILAAVLPAVFLMRYIYYEDTVEKEPRELLVRLVLLGVAAAIVSIFLESLGKKALSALIDADSAVYTVIFAFLIVAVVEEGAKFYFLRRRTWNDPNFNYRFDGIVYAVFVSLGFAAFENISYIMGYGLTVAVPRAILAIPGHMGFAVFMGLFYGRAKQYENKGDYYKRDLNLWAGYLSAVFLHGLYDTCVMIGNVLCAVLFVIYVVAMYIIVIRLVRRESSTDSLI